MRRIAGTWLAALFVSAALYATPLQDAVMGLTGIERYLANERLIGVLFEDEQAFFQEERISWEKVAATLKENGLLVLKNPAGNSLSVLFECRRDNALPMVRLVRESLQQMGFVDFLVKHALRNDETFLWELMLQNRRVPDPELLAHWLERQGIAVVDIVRKEDGRWHYLLNFDRMHLALNTIAGGQKLRLSRPVRPIWLSLSKVRRLVIQELPGSHWHPDCVVYDKSLNVIKTYQKETRKSYLSLAVPADAAYVRIDDRFILDNLKGGIKITARGR